ncbi:MAG: LicD family protein, partial [Anaeroplasmataceae bacterium]|nr:LicD family protein [Anaeroplasmataceae bacterium]
MKLGRKLDVKEIKEMELDILIKFKEFCERENIKFYLAYGTLLGAVRHKGFIPWDDDIDVVVTREDYDKLIEVLREKHIAENISASCYELDQTSLPFMKVYRNDTYTSCRAKSVHRGVWIDVFCLD